VAVSPALLFGAVANQVVDYPLIYAFAGQSRNERMTKDVPAL
jgi:hypothetical protein